jgi:asparaginyl-tRNA synthetase
MPTAYVKEIGRFNGQEVTVRGWLYNKRSSGKIKFLLVRDGTGVIQCVLDKSLLSPEVFDSYDELTQESSLMVTGKVREDKRAPGGYELYLSNIEVVQLAVDYPISPKEHGVEFLMDRRHLWLRSSRQHAILRVRNEVIKAIRDYFYENDFVLIDTPILTGAIGETASTLFSTEYFNLGNAYLAQTGQLYLEAACMSLGKVYCFGPTFRAEKSKTRRHLTEFWMVEGEMAYYDHEDNMEIQEELVVYTVERVLERSRADLEYLERDLSPLESVKRPFPRILYEEAIKILKGKGSKIEWGDDLGGEDETVLSSQYDRPLFVTCYPQEAKAFYMKPNPDDPRTFLCNDLLAPEGYGEIIGASQRDDDHDGLLERIKKNNLPVDAYRWYLDLRKYGSVPHSGFGLGVERTVAWICGLKHIRESIPFPRTIYRLYP